MGAETASYKVVKTLPVGGDGGFDFATLDRDGKYLYLPRSTHTQVVDASDGKVVGDILNNARSHGVALVPELGRGFISNGGDGTVQVFDIKSYASLGKIKAADDADCIIFDPASNDILTMCGDAHAMIAIAADVDVDSGKAKATIDLGGKPEFAAVDGKGNVFVDLVDKNEVVTVDIGKAEVTSKWSVSPGEKPTSMAFNPKSKRLFVGCRNQKLIVMDSNDGRVVADLPIGSGVDATVIHEGRVFSSCGDGHLIVVREASQDKYEVEQIVETAPRAKTMAVDSHTGKMFLPTADGQGRSITPGSFRVLVVDRAE
jgi:DNA-binding beta-propeller fold protein YncE